MIISNTLIQRLSGSNHKFVRWEKSRRDGKVTHIYFLSLTLSEMLYVSTFDFWKCHVYTLNLLLIT